LDTDATLEFMKDSSAAEIEDLSVEETSVLEDLGDVHLVRERIDLQFLEKGTLGTINFDTGFNNLLSGNNFDLTLDNLGVDLKVLEESGLLWVKTGWSSWNPYIVWGDHTWLGWGWSDFSIKNVFNLAKISVGEDNVGVSLKLEKDLVDVIILSPVGSTSGVEVGLTVLWGGVESGKGCFHEGILSHDHDGIDLSQLLSETTNLFGRNVVSINEESIVVFSSSLLESFPVGFLFDSLFRFLNGSWHFCLK